MRGVLSLTLGWAKSCSWLENNPCQDIKLPKETGGKKVIRTVLTPAQVIAIAGKLEEPYATLVLFLAASGLRIGEAIAVKESDFDGNVLHVTRRIYDGDEDAVKTLHSIRKLPIDPALVLRMRQLEKGEWVFRSRRGTPINPGNVLKRYVKPVAAELGLTIGGWHDFRHTLTTQMRRNGVHPKVISGILGHSKVDLAMNTYDHADVEDFRQPLAFVGGELLRNVTKNAASA
jgi:integrase